MSLTNTSIALSEEEARQSGSTARKTERTQKAMAVGSVLGAIAASSCCIVPLALFTVGAGGAWLGNLTAVAPYQPIFLVITFGFLATGFWMAYRKPKNDCEDGEYCGTPATRRLVKTALWCATLLVAAAAAFPYIAPALLGV